MTQLIHTTNYSTDDSDHHDSNHNSTRPTPILILIVITKSTTEY